MFALCIESSHARGMGHFYRALNLAEGLAAAGRSFVFYINDHLSSRELLAERSIPYRVVQFDNKAFDWQAKLVELDEICVWVDDRLDTDVEHARRVRAKGALMATFDNRGSGAEAANLHVAALCFDLDELLGGATPPGTTRVSTLSNRTTANLHFSPR